MVGGMVDGMARKRGVGGTCGRKVGWMFGPGADTNGNGPASGSVNFVRNQRK